MSPTKDLRTRRRIFLSRVPSVPLSNPYAAALVKNRFSPYGNPRIPSASSHGLAFGVLGIEKHTVKYETPDARILPQVLRSCWEYTSQTPLPSDQKATACW